MDLKVKNQVMTFFKIGGFHLRSEVALLLVEKIKDMDEGDRKEFIDKIYSNIQNQTLETANIQKEHMAVALRVISSDSTSLWNDILSNFYYFHSGMQSRQTQR
jgi:DNA polymerases epsilon N terminal